MTPTRDPYRYRHLTPDPNPDQVRMCHGGLAEAARLVGDCLRSEAAVDSDAARSESASESESEQSDAEDTDCEAALVACGFGPFGPLDGAARGGAPSLTSHHPALAAAPWHRAGRTAYSLQLYP